jgi:hypothetical protein
MHIVTLEISSREKISKGFLQALEGESQGEFMSFESPSLLFERTEFLLRPSDIIACHSSMRGKKRTEI